MMMNGDRRAFLQASGGAIAALAISGELAALEARPGRLKQSVSRWPYGRIPLPEFCRRAKEIGLVAIDLLYPDEWQVARDAGLVCSMGYATRRREFIPNGFNDAANHAMLLSELESAIPDAARAGVPNVIAMFGNRRGRSDKASRTASPDSRRSSHWRRKRGSLSASSFSTARWTTVIIMGIAQRSASRS
jgi:hydroxypyruvate isomerase